MTLCLIPRLIEPAKINYLQDLTVGNDYLYIYLYNKIFISNCIVLYLILEDDDKAYPSQEIKASSL